MAASSLVDFVFKLNLSRFMAAKLVLTSTLYISGTSIRTVYPGCCCQGIRSLDIPAQFPLRADYKRTLL